MTNLRKKSVNLFDLCLVVLIKLSNLAATTSTWFLIIAIWLPKQTLICPLVANTSDITSPSLLCLVLKTVAYTWRNYCSLISFLSHCSNWFLSGMYLLFIRNVSKAAHIRNLFCLKPTALLCQLLMNIWLCRLILQISTNAPVLF